MPLASPNSSSELLEPFHSIVADRCVQIGLHMARLELRFDVRPLFTLAGPNAS